VEEDQIKEIFYQRVDFLHKFKQKAQEDWEIRIINAQIDEVILLYGMITGEDYPGEKLPCGEQTIEKEVI